MGVFVTHLLQGYATMSKTRHFLVSLVFLIIVIRSVSCDPESQPKIVSRDGDLVFESARDKNITIRLKGASNLMINDVDVLDAIQKVSLQLLPGDEVNIASLPDLMDLLKTDLRSLTSRLTRLENRTSSTQQGVVRRLAARVRSLVRRVNDLESKLKEDDCSPNPCKNGGTCYDLYENFHCECLDAWTGKTCEQDVDECYTYAGTELGCQHNSECINTPGGYTCVCKNGFRGIHCQELGNDCSTSRPGELCGHGTCVPANNQLGYQCLCDAGWKLDNQTQACSVDVNECLEMLVPCHTSCINLPGSFMCGPCPNGYTGNGIKCQDIDECATNNGGCSTSPKVQCINTEGSYRCGNCPPGWTGDGRYCSQSETNECAASNICHPLARCEYISNVAVCVCPEGMTGSGYGPAGCRSGSSNPCNDHQCQNGGTCVSRGRSYSCICPTGFVPPFCQNADPCTNSPCLNGGTCIRMVPTNTFRCECPASATGNLCENSRSPKGCGTVFRDRTGELTYPPEGGEYPSNVGCAWVIRTTTGKVLNITFTHFDVEPHPDCNKDFLQLNDGRSLATPLIGRFCGNQLPNGGNILLSQEAVFLWFHTDNETSATGFSLTWNTTMPVCGGNKELQFGDHGVIKSPGYPGMSPPNRECLWVITAPYGRRILLQFYEVVMGRSRNCTKNSLIIYDTNEVLERVCETSLPSPKYTSSNIARIHFSTDWNRQTSLFQIHYEVVAGRPGCGGLFTEPEGKIQFTLDTGGCVFLIQQPAGVRISLTFHEMDQIISHYSIKIYDGRTDDDPLLLQATGVKPDNVTSSSNFMLIKILIPTINSKMVFLEATYKMVCGQLLNNMWGGSFSTPNYPRPYHNGLTCKYLIVGPVNSIAHLNITDYDISEYPGVCDDSSDYVQFFYNTNGPGERHCKDSVMHIVAPSNYLRIEFHSRDNPQQRRGLSASYAFEAIGCGGVLRDTEGVIESPAYTSVMYPYCEWILEAPETHVINLDLQYERTGTKCGTDEIDLRIFLNRTQGADLIESYCGQQKRVITTVQSNLATIFLKLNTPAESNSVARLLTGKYKFLDSATVCGHNYTTLSGYIRTPGWPREYLPYLDCVWVIHAPLGHKIELVVKNFTLEGTRCNNDFLEIRNGPSKSSPLIGTYCGIEIPPHIPSFTNHLYLRFKTDSTIEYPGFEILYRQMATGCGGTLNSHSGSIASPHYPEISRGPVQCDWKIYVSQGSVIDVEITKLSREANLCSSDVLTIYDGDSALSNRLQLNCSDSDTSITFTSSANVIHVRYSVPSVGAASGEQFYLAYDTNCQHTLPSFSGVIESPNFPSNYPGMLKCEWNIIGRSSDTFNLTFSHFELEATDQECIYDVFEVIDMKGEDQLQTHRICTNPPEVLSSDGNRLVIKFKSDYKDGGIGFRLEFKRNGCGGYYTRSSAIFSSPKYPFAVDVDCEWVIEVTSGQQIVLEIFDIHIESEKPDCSANGLIVKNEKNDERELLKECRVSRMPMTVTSHGRRMYVRFYSDSVRVRKYFKASYRTRDSNCGGIFRGNSGVITSPNYPQNYPENTYCEWMIRVESVSTIEFIFEDLSLPFGSNCSKGAVEVYDYLPKNLIVSLCSDGYGVKHVSQSNMINMYLNSRGGPPAKGFLMKYKKACSGVLTLRSGYLKSYITDDTCRWVIQANDTSAKITLSVLRIECSCDDMNATECHKTRGIEVATLGGKTLLSFCDHHPPAFTSDSQQLVVTTRNVLFIGRYSTLETACGGFITSLRGTLASPYYPESYPSNIECMWTIKAAPGSYLELNILEMDIAKSDNCNEDYLEIREKSSTGKLLGLFCSDTLPDEGLRIFEQVWIKFRSSENTIGKAFKISWTHAQLNEISGSSGIIQAPTIAAIRSEKNSFQWRITVTSEKVIKLSFREYNGGLQLYDGYDNTALPIDIQLSPWDVTSHMNVIYLVSDNQLLDQFQIFWQAVSKTAVTTERNSSACGGTLVLASDFIGKIVSPGYPDGYENDLNCEWLIKPAVPTEHAVVAINDVRLELLTSCSVDYLKISSSSNLIDWNEELKVCDNSQIKAFSRTVVHGTPYLKLEFVTDPSINRTGFEVTIYPACGGNLTGSVGRIPDSLFKPEQIHIRALKLNCTWHVEVPSGRQIRFNFQFPFDAGRSAPDICTKTYTLIRDGVDEGAPILSPGRICSSTKLNGTITTSSNRATIKYIFEDFNPFLTQYIKLWNLTYRAFSDCGGEVRLTSYSSSINISSPNYPNVPNPHIECTWTVVAPPGEAIQAEAVDRFDMNTRKCGQEFIEFRDGGTRLAPLIGNYCTRPPVVRSSGNIVYIRYRTDIPEPRNGFKLNVSLTGCGGTFTQIRNVITSTNYPAPGGYPSNSVCDYIIKVPEFYRLNLTFTDIHLPYNASNVNASERIEVYQTFNRDSTNLIELMTVIYGNVTIMPGFEADTSTVLIRFVSSRANNVYRGFRLKYDRLFGSCSKDVNGESGVITSRLIPRRPPLFILCRYRITVPKGRRVTVRILESDGLLVGSRTFTVMFWNDFMMSSRITSADFRNSTFDRPVSSTDNRMYIRILGSQLFSPHTLKIEYSSSEVSSCPDDITADSGSISIAGIDLTQNFYCTSEIVLNGRETIAFNVTRFTVAGIMGRLPIYAVRFQGLQTRSNQVGLNMNLTNSMVRMSSRHILLTISQNEIGKLLNFEATFRKYPCGGELGLSRQFSISFGNLTNIPGGLECVWFFSNAVGKAYDVFANISFSLPCEDEYLVLHSGVSIDELQVAKLCKDSTFNTTRVTVIPFYVTYHTSAYQPGNPMQVDLQEALMCGGHLEITLQQSIYLNSRDYKNNIECVWDLRTTRGFYLRLEFIGRFFIESSKDCTKDYLELRQQKNGIWMTMARYCGRDTPPTINTTSDHLQLIFRSDDAVTGDGFAMQVKSTCDLVMNVTKEPQLIWSPLRWSINRHRLKCNYVLQTDTDHYIEVKFKRFVLSSRNVCSLRRMTVEKWTDNSDLTSLEPWCESSSATDVRAKKLIKLTYEDAIDAGDYLIEYMLTTCDGTIEQPRWIESLKDSEGSAYSANMRCSWKIIAPDGHNIFIQFKYIDMEKADDCALDYVAVYRGAKVDNAERLGKLCGNITLNAPSFLIEGNQALVEAVSDASIQYRGFLAQIMFSKSCDERLSLSEANSPVDIERDFDVGGNAVMHCVYRLMAPPDYRIQIELTEMRVNAENTTCGEECENCNFVEILNSFRSGHFVFGRYCRAGSVKPKVVTAFKDATIRLNLELPGQYRIKINLQLVPSLCGDQSEYKLEGESPIQLLSPKRADGLYPANVHCTWKFFSKRPFELKFQPFNLQNESDVTGFCLDYVHIRYTTSSDRTMKNEEHCGTISSYTLAVESMTSDSSAEVTFHTDEAIESTGFKLLASNKLSCNQVYTELSGVIKIETEKEMTCINDIILPENYTVNIVVSSLSFNDNNCSVNSLKVFDKKTNRQIHENCVFRFGTKNSFFSTSQIRLDLKAPSHLGVSIAYFGSLNPPFPGCGGSIQTPNGLIASPDYQNYRNRSSCRWNLTTTATNRFQLFFNEFNMGSICKMDYLDIYEIAKDGKETLSRHYCGSELLETYRSKNNRIAIVSVTSPDFDGTGWQISYYTFGDEANRINFMDSINRVIYDQNDF